MLLAGAGLMIRTVQELVHLDPGFRPDHVVTTRMTLAGEQWTDDRQRAFYADVVDRVKAIPGVRNAALTTCRGIAGGATA